MLTVYDLKKEETMRSLKPLLGSVVLLLGSNVSINADELLAGPVPVDFGGTLTCSAINNDNVDHNIFLTLIDANFTTAPTFDCGVVKSQHSCSVAKPAFSIGSGVSPFHCLIFGFTTPVGGRALDQGSICATVGSTGTTCLQGLPVPEPAS
jgi:hypothetical protein